MSRTPRKRKPRKNQRKQQNQPAKADPAPTPTTIQVANANKMNTSAGNGGAPQQKAKQNRRPWLTDRRLNTFFAGAVAVFAFGQVLVGYWQWGQMERTLNIMELEQRARIAITRTEMQPLVEGEAASMFFDVSNIGKSPGYVYAIECVLAIHDASDERDIQTGKSLNERMDEIVDNLYSDSGDGLRQLTRVRGATSRDSGPYVTSTRSQLTKGTIADIRSGAKIVMLLRRDCV